MIETRNLQFEVDKQGKYKITLQDEDRISVWKDANPFKQFKSKLYVYLKLFLIQIPLSLQMISKMVQWMVVYYFFNRNHSIPQRAALGMSYSVI